MSSLAAQQQALLRALFDWPAESAAHALSAHTQGDGRRGLMAYQTNGHELAQRALAAAYPVLGELLGSESFAALARAYWHACPPRRGDLAQWGGALDQFVRDDEQLADEHYLPDVATLEWALHQALSAADQAADGASFALLTTADPASVCLDLVPGCAALRSPWPVVSIVCAHRDGTPSLDQAGQRLRAGVAESAVVWRAGWRACVRQAQTGELEFLLALRDGGSLAAALEAAPTLDFGAWLPMAVQSGLVLGARPMAPTS
jgi:hypothetical protein